MALAPPLAVEARSSARRVGRQVALDIVVQALEAEEHLVRQVVRRGTSAVEGLDEVDVEVALGLGRGPVVRRAEEQVAHALDAALLPLDLVLPDLEAGDVGGLVAALHQRLMAL
jgi:hypothetical protein